MPNDNLSSSAWTSLDRFDGRVDLNQTTGRLRFGSCPILSVPDKIQLYLVRHGETLANQKKIFQGSDQETEWTSLSTEGRAQSQWAGLRLSEKLEKHHADSLIHVVSSPAERARHTADYFVKCSEKKLRVRFQLLDCLHEIRFGDMSGKTEEEIRAMGPEQTRFIEEYRYRANAAVYAENSESFLDVMGRIYLGLKEWIKTLEVGKPQVVIFYTHMITGAAVRTVLGDKSLREEDPESGEFVRWRQMLGNAEPYVWNSAAHAFEKMSF